MNAVLEFSTQERITTANDKAAEANPESENKSRERRRMHRIHSANGEDQKICENKHKKARRNQAKGGALNFRGDFLVEFVCDSEVFSKEGIVIDIA